MINPSVVGREASAVPHAEESPQRGRDETQEGDGRDEYHVWGAQHSRPSHCRWNINSNRFFLLSLHATLSYFHSLCIA